ncbi:MAG: phosphoglycerate kinase, partial [archaeon]|nr:phosphoglycerate kinase [archaeon]
TVTGFVKLPRFAGPVLERELVALEKLDNKNEPKLLILGGAKPEDSISILGSMLEKGYCNEVCLGGLFGEMFLAAKGTKFGKKDKFLQEKGYAKVEGEIKKILSKHRDKIILPVDLAASNDGNDRKEIRVNELPTDMDIMDIGRETTEMFKKKIRSSKIVVYNGPMGVYENPIFSIGTKKILETIAFGRTFSILGGGDTERAIFALGLLPQDFSHLSLAGKALLEYLAGEKLPGLEILKQ